MCFFYPLVNWCNLPDPHGEAVTLAERSTASRGAVRERSRFYNADTSTGKIMDVKQDDQPLQGCSRENE